MKKSREQLLKTLKSVAPGLAGKELIEQSTCFVFSNGRVYTYNDEVACHAECQMGEGFSCAVSSGSLLRLLGSMNEEEIEIDLDGSVLRVTGKRKRAELPVEAEILLPVTSIDQPTKWTSVDEKLIAGLEFVKECAGQKETEFLFTCVHLTPEWIEACDYYQMARWAIQTGLESDALLRRQSIMFLRTMVPKKMAETDSWLHFRSSDKVTVSCRRHIIEYPDLGEFLVGDGVPVKFPDGLAAAIDRARIFSSNQSEVNRVEVWLRKGKMLLIGQGHGGKYQEELPAAYDGEPVKFVISPDILQSIAIHSPQVTCQLLPTKIKVPLDDCVYVSCLGAA